MKLSNNFFRSSKCPREHQEACQECLEEIFVQFGNSEAPKISIEKFAMTSEAKSPQTIFAWRIGNKFNTFTLALVEYCIQYMKGSRHGHGAQFIEEAHLYVFGHLKLNKDFGATYIRPESFKDKILEMFVPVEIDFAAAPEFSSKYYVLSNDKEKFIQAVPHALMRYLTDIERLEIEFRNKECLFRFEGPVEKKKSLQLCEIGVTLDRILNQM